MFAIVFASVASVCWIYTHTLTFTFNEWTFRISRSRHRQLLSVARYDLSQMLFLFRRPGTFLLVVELEIEWKTKTSAHENCKQNSHRSQSMVDAYMLPLILSLSFCVSQFGSAAMTCLYCTIWYVSTWTSLSHRQTLTCSVFVLCLLFIFVLFFFFGCLNEQFENIILLEIRVVWRLDFAENSLMPGTNRITLIWGMSSIETRCEWVSAFGKWQERELLTCWKISMAKKLCASYFFTRSGSVGVRVCEWARRFRVHVKVWIIKIELFCGCVRLQLVYLSEKLPIHGVGVWMCAVLKIYNVPQSKSCKWQRNQWSTQYYVDCMVSFNNARLFQGAWIFATSNRQ